MPNSPLYLTLEKVMWNFRVLKLIICGLFSTLVASCDTPELTGNVVDIVGRPLVGVTVHLSGQEKRVQTDKTGRFHIPYTPGQIILEYSRVDYRSKTVSLTLSNHKKFQVLTQTLRQTDSNKDVRLAITHAVNVIYELGVAHAKAEKSAQALPELSSIRDRFLERSKILTFSKTYIAYVMYSPATIIFPDVYSAYKEAGADLPELTFDYKSDLEKTHLPKGLEFWGLSGIYASQLFDGVKTGRIANTDKLYLYITYVEFGHRHGFTFLLQFALLGTDVSYIADRCKPNSEPQFCSITAYREWGLKQPF